MHLVAVAARQRTASNSAFNLPSDSAIKAAEENIPQAVQNVSEFIDNPPGQYADLQVSLESSQWGSEIHVEGGILNRGNSVFTDVRVCVDTWGFDGSKLASNSFVVPEIVPNDITFFQESVALDKEYDFTVSEAYLCV